MNRWLEIEEELKAIDEGRYVGDAFTREAEFLRELDKMEHDAEVEYWRDREQPSE